MTEADLALFLNSFDSCIENERFLEIFYDDFMGSSEEVRALFAHTDLPKQRRALKASLYVMVAAIARRQADVSSLVALVERHRALKIRDEHYELWLESLITAAARCSEQWDADTARVWRSALREGIAVMTGGA